MNWIRALSWTFFMWTCIMASSMLFGHVSDDATTYLHLEIMTAVGVLIGIQIGVDDYEGLKKKS